MNRIQEISALGQSVWLDNIQRRMLENGEIQAMIDRGDIRGITSNPTIFEHAIANSTDYDEALNSLAWAGWDAEKIFWELVVEDIREATDLFGPLYEQTNGGDGFVSIEVSPFLAGYTQATAAQAQQLWVRVARPNLMVKIPATPSGIPAIRAAIAAGLNINITLIFSRARYAEVMEAYLSGLEERVAAGRAIDHIASVASFFVSRVDTKVDGLLPKDSPLRGKAAIANAVLAYDDFAKTFAGERWEQLRSRGAQVQRPLWASTSTKNPAYPDTLYVDNLIGPQTINTMPPQTLEATRDHARTEITITRNVDDARRTMEELEHLGISMKDVTQQLEAEGVKSFSDAVTELLKTIDGRRQAAVRALGPLAESVAMRISELDSESVPTRIWTHDPTLWSQDPAGQAEILKRMGWLDSPTRARTLLPLYQDFVAEIQKAAYTGALVLGMGGSSLSAEVLSTLFGADPAFIQPGARTPAGSLSLAILDSTHPDQVREMAGLQNLPTTLHIVASKSGGTAEVTAMLDYFWALQKGDGDCFVAVTDPGTSLEALARQLRFRRFFTADPNVGGRYSALTDFGMLPAALLGIDLNRLLDRAEWMRNHCRRDTPAARSPGIALGAILAASALAGRDKLTLVADSMIVTIPNWIEQLVAESSGKEGRGIVPVALEPLDAPQVYGSDRLFVYLRQTGEYDEAATALSQAGHPVIVLALADIYDVGAEFFRWEFAVATACHILGVNAFDQPDVQDSKDRTAEKIHTFRATGSLDEGAWDVSLQGADPSAPDVEKILAFIGQAAPGEYVGINAYLPRNQHIFDSLQRLRVAVREKGRNAVTLGFGPRFQHSTGQLHKGGPNSGLFIQIVSDTEKDLDIPNEGMTFGTFIRAQALGDYEALLARGRRVLRLRLSKPTDLDLLVRAVR